MYHAPPWAASGVICAFHISSLARLPLDRLRAFYSPKILFLVALSTFIFTSAEAEAPRRTHVSHSQVPSSIITGATTTGKKKSSGIPARQASSVGMVQCSCVSKQFRNIQYIHPSYLACFPLLNSTHRSPITTMV